MCRLPTYRAQILCAGALALAICQSTAAAEQAAAPAAVKEGVVVLHSGGVLRGTISIAGERYVVTQPNSVVDVPATQVMLIADSLDDAYQRQRRQLPRDTSEAHLALAEWCLRYDLLQPAAEELADARRLDRSDPRIALIERRLAVASQPKPPRPAVTTATVTEADPSADELRKLEAMIADLPAGVVERFTRKVQPLVVNNCTTSGCHQRSGRQVFQLDRAVVHGLSNRRTTLRNLAATLALVNHDVPPKSVLLTIHRRSHAGMSRPILGPRQDEQLLQLVDWVAMVTEAGVYAEPTASPTDGDEAPATAARVSRPRARQPTVTDRNVVTTSFDEEASIAPSHELRHGSQLESWQPRDAFDPEIFNRRFPPTDAAKMAPAQAADVSEESG